MAVVLLVLVGCSSPADPGSALDDAIKAGADCPELYALRYELEPELRADGRMERVNGDLRSIGCFNSTATRTDR